MTRRLMCFTLITLVAAGAGATRANVPDNAVTIKVGQELFISFIASGDSLVSPKILPDGNGPDPTVTVQVTQNGPTRTLLVTNGFAKALNYRAVARKRGSRREIELPVSGVRGGMQSVTTLGEPFDELVLYEFHLQS
jgi:hypothetical protein